MLPGAVRRCRRVRARLARARAVPGRHGSRWIGGLQLKKSGDLRFKPKNPSLKITGGDLDPITGAGTVDVSGGFKARTAGGKAKVSILTVTFGANGGPGTIAAKVGKKRIERFGKLSGGKTAREGFGARITGATAKITSKGVKALSKGKKKGASAAKTAPRHGRRDDDPEDRRGGARQRLPRRGQRHQPLSKLAAHCIDAEAPPARVGCLPDRPGCPGSASQPGFQVPRTGGSIAPDLNDGKVITAGGQGLRKNNGP